MFWSVGKTSIPPRGPISRARLHAAAKRLSGPRPIGRSCGGPPELKVPCCSRYASPERRCLRSTYIEACCVEPLSAVRERWPVIHVFHKGQGNIGHPFRREHLDTAAGKTTVQNLGWCHQGRVASPGQVPATLQRSKTQPSSLILRGTLCAAASLCST